MRLGYGKAGMDYEPSGEYQVLLPEELPAAGESEVERALEAPFGEGLLDLSGARKAAILVSDSTRPVPSHLMIPPLAARLREMGVKDVGIVFGLGTHRRMDAEEVRRILGPCVGMDHLQHDKERCVSLGETGRGTPVEVFEEVAASDIIVATGNVEYHYYAGYSGGAKAVLPGVSSERSITKNHMMMRDPESRSGNVHSPVRLDMEEAAGIAGLDFILNVVLNSRKEIVRAVAGDYVEAHRAGALVVDQMYRREVEPAEIVIVCAGGSPKDINLYQAQKALDNAKEAVKPGGTLILLAECSEGLGNTVFERWVAEAGCAEECVDRFGREYEFGGHKAALIAEMSLKNELILVSSLPRVAAKSCFFEPARDLEEALSMARKSQGAGARTVIMPYGGLTLARSV